MLSTVESVLGCPTDGPGGSDRLTARVSGSGAPERHPFVPTLRLVTAPAKAGPAPRSSSSETPDSLSGTEPSKVWGCSGIRAWHVSRRGALDRRWVRNVGSRLRGNGEWVVVLGHCGPTVVPRLRATPWSVRKVLVVSSGSLGAAAHLAGFRSGRGFVSGQVGRRRTVRGRPL